MRWILKSFLKDKAGAALVEMSIVTPFLVILVFGVVEFGNALHHYHLITTGLRDAARYLARTDEPDAADKAKGQQLAVYGKIGETEQEHRVCLEWAAEGSCATWWETTDVKVALVDVEDEDKVALGKIVRVSTDVEHQGFRLLSLLSIKPLRFQVFQEERFIGE